MISPYSLGLYTPLPDGAKRIDTLSELPGVRESWQRGKKWEGGDDVGDFSLHPHTPVTLLRNYFDQWLGYDVQDRKLMVNDAEAASVRRIFERFVELGSATALARQLKAEGVVGKRGRPVDKGVLYKLLNNRVYVGEAVHKGKASMLGAASGAVAGLVAVTPAAGFVGPMGAIAIGPDRLSAYSSATPARPQRLPIRSLSVRAPLIRKTVRNCRWS